MDIFEIDYLKRILALTNQAKIDDQIVVEFKSMTDDEQEEVCCVVSTLMRTKDFDVLDDKRTYEEAMEIIKNAIQIVQKRHCVGCGTHDCDRPCIEKLIYYCDRCYKIEQEEKEKREKSEHARRRAEYQGKIDKYGLIKGEALDVLLKLQHKRQEATEMINKALERNNGIEAVEELLKEIYK